MIGLTEYQAWKSANIAKIAALEIEATDIIWFNETGESYGEIGHDVHRVVECAMIKCALESHNIWGLRINGIAAAKNAVIEMLINEGIPQSDITIEPEVELV